MVAMKTTTKTVPPEVSPPGDAVAVACAAAGTTPVAKSERAIAALPVNQPIETSYRRRKSARVVAPFASVTRAACPTSAPTTPASCQLSSIVMPDAMTR